MSLVDLVGVRSTARPEPAREDDADQARQIIGLYHDVLQRNPDAAGFAHYLGLLRSGVQLSDISASFRSSPEARALATGTRAPLDQIAWKAEDRPVHVVEQFWITDIELTNRCPFRCVMCPRTNHMTRPEGLMELSVFQRIIDELATMNPKDGKPREPIWLHHFGESLVHPQFGDFIRYAQSHGIKARLSVNPLMLSEGIAEELLDAEPAYLVFALDGHDDASFEKIRGVKNAYEKSKRNLMRFLNKKVARKKKINATLSVIDFPLNEKTAAQSRQEWERYWRSVPGIDGFLWKEFVTWNGSVPEINALGRNTDGTDVLQRHVRHLKVTCDWPWKRLVITWNGDVLACCYDFDAKYVVGNVRTRTLTEIWNDAPMQALRREFISGQVRNPLCASCKYLRASHWTAY